MCANASSMQRLWAGRNTERITAGAAVQATTQTSFSSSATQGPRRRSELPRGQATSRIARMSPRTPWPSRHIVAAALFAAPFGLHAQRAGNGFSADRLARIDRFLQAAVDSNRIGGATALVLRDGKPVYEKSVGWADKESNRKMSPDNIFRIASQTKA